jgi:hypothetical protein
MLIRADELAAIRAGTVDLAFRRWDTPRVRVGTRMRTAIGLVEVTSVESIEMAAIGADDARRAGAVTLPALLEALATRPDKPVYRVGLRYAGGDPRVELRESPPSASEIGEIRSALDRLDRASRSGPWTYQTLGLIGRCPQVRAPELATRLGREVASFKRDVRKLKELGLTESLEVGYRLSPRGRAVLEAHPSTA